jgi:hypothetical protein
MATYVNDLRLKEIGTGESSGTWGTESNVNLELIASAMGHGDEAVANASTHTITMADGAADEFRCTFLRLTGGGQACTVTLAPNTLSHTWIIRNTTSYALTLTQGSGANVIIAAGQAKMVTTDGAGSGAVVYECLEDLELGGTLTVGVDDTGQDVKFFGATSGKYWLWDESADGVVQQGTLTVGVDDTGYDVKFFGATSGAYMLWDESADDLKLVGAAGLTVAGDIDVDGTANLDVVDIDGAVDMASTLGVTGVVTANAGVVVDELTIDADTITATDDFIIDAVGDITLDADGGDVVFKDGGTSFLEIDKDGDNARLKNPIADGDIKLQGVDGSSTITALTFDISEAGAATFNDSVTADTLIGGASNFDIRQNTSDGSDNQRTRIGGGGDVSQSRGAFIELAGNEHTNTGDIILNAGDVSGGDIVFKTDNTARVTIDDAGGMLITTADNADTLSLVSTDADANSGPNLRMYRNSGSPADSDAIALIDFEGRNDNSQDVVYAAIDTRIVDASDGTEDGRIELATILAGTAGTSRILMDATETAFNDNSKDLDFRVESDNLTHALFVQGSDGNVGIGTSSLFGELSIDSNAAPATSGSFSTGLTIHNGTGGTAVNIGTNDSGGYSYMQSSYVNNAGVARGLQLITGASVVLTLDISNNATFAGDVAITGALSKGSGTFRIPHGLRENYDLCHSFVEGPQCDLIYRGKVDLVDGRATVSMDTKYGMTAGTFAWLTKDIQTFTSNETGWDAVKSSFSGDTITIQCQNTSSTDTISWMVVAERDDPNIRASEITDADGNLLIERASKPGFWDAEEE